MPRISPQEFEQLPLRVHDSLLSRQLCIANGGVVRHESNYLAITTVVQELLSLGKSRLAAVRISSRGRSPRMIGQ